MPITIKDIYQDRELTYHSRELYTHPNSGANEKVLHCRVGIINPRNRYYPTAGGMDRQYAFVLYGGPSIISKRILRGGDMFVLDFLENMGVEPTVYEFDSHTGDHRILRRNFAGIRLLKGDLIYHDRGRDGEAFMNACTSVQKDINLNEKILPFRAREICAGIETVRDYAFAKWNV